MPLVDRSDSMLLVIDVQEGFYPDSRADVDRIAFGHFLDRVAWVVGVAARLRVPIIVTEEDRARNGDTAERVAINLPPGAAVFEKAVFAAPDNPEISAAIEEIGASTAVLVGLETDVCVSHTALRLQDESKRVVVVGDALFSPGEAHENGLRRLREAGVELVSAKELFYDWVPTLAGVREFRESNPDLVDPPGFSL
jgi:nicotinamidase-related amidase